MINTNKTRTLKKFSKLIIRLYYKTNFDINNTSSILLPTDLLRTNVKYKLFKLIIANIETVFYKIIRENILLTPKESQSIFFYLIQKTTQDLLTAQYGDKLKINPDLLKNCFYTKFILNETTTLITIPFQIIKSDNDKVFRSKFFPIYNKAYDNLVEALFDNLIIEVSNTITSFILNELSYIYEIRKNLYKSSFLSLRNVERFRNNLSWQSKIKSFVMRPADIYNSQQSIWLIRTTGICYRVIYANRSTELLYLKNLSLITVAIIEIKDFLISRADESLYFIGKVLRNILISGVGQVIGLLWRGIIEGLKN